MTMPEFDVVVVGAGPAGSVLARLLALQGIKVLMLDAAAFPRRKPCGESLNPGAVLTLSRLHGGRRLEHLLGAAAIPFASLSGWNLNSEGASLAAPFPAGKTGIGCRRELFDQWLVEQACLAGVQFQDQTRVERLIWENDRVAGVEARLPSRQLLSIRTHYVAGSDGIRSAVARSAKLSRFGKLRKAALTARVDGVRGLSGNVELFLSGDSVIGLAPIGGGQANMTAAIRGERALEVVNAGKAEFILKEARQWEELHERLQNAEIEGAVLACGPFDRAVRSAALDGMVLIGDAAGYYDPMTGQGIYRAIRSAELAAPALMEALQTGSFAPLNRYERQRAFEFAAPLRLQKLIEQASRHEWLLRASIQAIGSSRALISRLAESIGDSIRY